MGTLGGGLRRVDITPEGPQDTLLLTREEGLGSNLIFSLAGGSNGVIWAGTEEGVSRLQVDEAPIRMTHLSALDGLGTPVRDLAIDRAGTLWLATGRGLFRIVRQGGLVRGEVRTADGEPIVGADIIALGTPFRTVTDVTGHFILANLPAGSYQLQINGQLADGGPFTSAEREVDVSEEEGTIDVVVLEDG